MRAGIYLLVAASAWLVSSGALAANNCTFRNVGRVMQLQRDCWTDATLLIPNGATLDGRNRTITAVDPDVGHFVGAIVRNAGPTANVRNLTLQTAGLIDVCDSAEAPDQRLRGILFDGASGAITGNRVLNIRQAGSGCQEGAAIEVRAPATAPVQYVTIVDNRISGYQKTGVFVSGAIDATIMLNRIAGLGPVDFIAQNGIQLAAGARGRIQWNRVEQNIYTGDGAASTGILLTGAGSPLEIEINRVDDNDIGIRVVNTSGAVVQWNDVRGSTFDGIAIDGLQADALGNQVVRNRLTENAVGIDVFGAGAVSNEVVGNRIADSLLAGIQVAFGATGNVLDQNRLQRNVNGVFVSADDNDIVGNSIANSDSIGLHVEGSGNDVQDNSVSGSGALDIENLGSNTYDGNSCTSSSGAPVDCP
jgi:parallel beta-helix repeat protein